MGGPRVPRIRKLMTMFWWRSFPRRPPHCGSGSAYPARRRGQGLDGDQAADRGVVGAEDPAEAAAAQLRLNLISADAIGHLALSAPVYKVPHVSITNYDVSSRPCFGLHVGRTSASAWDNWSHRRLGRPLTD